MNFGVLSDLRGQRLCRKFGFVINSMCLMVSNVGGDGRLSVLVVAWMQVVERKLRVQSVPCTFVDEWILSCPFPG